MTVYLTGKEKPEEIRGIVEPLTKSGYAVQLRFVETAAQPPKIPLATTPVAAAVKEDSSHLLDMFLDGLKRGNAALSHLDGLGADWGRAWATAVNRTFSSPGLTLLAVVAAAAAAGVAARMAASSVLKRTRAPSAAFHSQLLVKLTTLAHDGIGLLAYWAAGGFLADRWTPEDDVARAAALAFMTYPLLTGGYLALGRFLLRPGDSGRRLMPLPNAERHFRLLLGYGTIGPCSLLGIHLCQDVASDPMAPAGLFTIVGGLITLYKLAWFWIGRHDFTALWLAGDRDPAPGWRRRTTGALLPWVLVGSALAIWAVGRIAAVAPDGARWANAAGLTQFLVVLTPILAAGAAALMRDLLCPDAEIATRTPIAQAFSKVVEPVAASIVWVSGLVVLGRIWAFSMLDMVSPALMTLLLDALWVCATVMMGWVALSFLNALFDAYAPQRGPSMPGEDDDQDEAIQTRLGSVLPMLRAFALGMAVGVTALVLLSRIGVDIGPMLAGFGIFGLALSFGSQALVRDIVSGIFFIADDAFRVGEYIDTGRLKGTVEKITLRSVQLRHQSGQVHTIPLGQIASVTNASRDWATVKFNIRLDRGVDVEQARKIIKKTGAAMMEDAELAPEMILPLKLQGIAEVADSALVLRLKFTSKPARSSWIQREALKRVHAALHAAGIEFATNAVIVRGGDAASGAAASATLQPGTTGVV